AARRSDPPLVWAHFLVPTGFVAMLACRASLVVTAHGQDVRNIGKMPGVRLATRIVIRHATAVVAVSHYLRRELEARIPDARGKVKVVDSGVDLTRFREQGADEAASRVGWPSHRPAYLCVGSLIER